MNRTSYYNYIEEKLNTLSVRISTKASQNILDLNIHSENLFSELFNCIFEYKFINVNLENQNVKGIDLVDNDNKIIAQVTSTCTKEKIEKSLTKINDSIYSNYTFMFITSSGDATKLRTHTYSNNSVIFDPKSHIYDVKKILNHILHLDITKLKSVYELIKDELGTEPDLKKLDSNLTMVITALRNERLMPSNDSIEVNSFEIDRKIEVNELLSVQDIIKDYVVYYEKLNSKYNEFDKESSIASASILQSIKKEYIALSKENILPDEVFWKIINNLMNVVINSKNYVEISSEELEYCVSIIVVDAFIKCKIFENPEGYDYVTT